MREAVIAAGLTTSLFIALVWQIDNWYFEGSEKGLIADIIIINVEMNVPEWAFY